MPFCPKCNDEYDEGMTECYECGVPLVAGGDAADAAGEQSGSEPYVVFTAGNASDREQMLRALEQWQIPFKKTEDIPELAKRPEGPGLAVPADFGQKAMQILSSIAPMTRNRPAAAGGGCSGCAAPSGEISDSPVLNLSYGELIRRGDGVRDELMELVVKGSPAAKKKAARLLIGVTSSGTDSALKLMKVALEKEEMETAGIIMGVLRGEEYRGPGWREFLPHLGMQDKVKIKALEIIGHLGELDAVPAVMPMLEDAAPEVRDEADNTLCLLTDMDMGFDGAAPSEERERAVIKWRDWWEAR